MLNKNVLKTFGFWAAVLSAVLGVTVSQHLIVDGSTLSDAVGWLLTLLGSGSAGYQAKLVDGQNTVE